MNLKQIFKWLELQKEGALLGGFIASTIVAIHTNDPTQFAAVMRIFPDDWMVQLTGAIFIGMTIGALLDSVYKPRR